MKYSELKKDIKKKKISFRKLAGEIGMTPQGFHVSLREETLKISTLERICEVIEETPAKYFEGGQEVIRTDKKEKKRKRLAGHERIKQLVDEKTGGNQAKFAEEIGTTRDRIHNIINGSGNFRMDLVNMIMTRWPDVDLYWLITGRRRYRDKVLKRLDEIYEEIREMKRKGE